MKSRVALSIALAVAIALPNVSSAGGSAGPGSVSWQGGQSASVAGSGGNLSDYVKLFLEKAAEFGTTLVKGLATGGPHGPSASGGAESLIKGAGEVGVELGITHTKVRDSQLNEEIVYAADLYAAGVITLDEAIRTVKLRGPGLTEKQIERLIKEAASN